MMNNQQDVPPIICRACDYECHSIVSMNRHMEQEHPTDLDVEQSKDGTNTDTSWLDPWKPIFVNEVIPAEFRQALTTKMEQVRKDYERKVEDLTVETRVHSKVFEWAKTRSPYVGEEAIGYKSAQDDIEKLLPKWREEAVAELQAHHKEAGRG